MAKVLALANDKGGAGKTTSTRELSYVFHNQGFRTLAIDFSSQGSLTKQRGRNPERLESQGKTIINSLTDNVPVADIIISGNPDFVPSHKGIIRRQIDHGYTILREALLPIQDRYDYILIDTPPEVEHLIKVALTAADAVVIPVEPDDLSIDGLADFLKLTQEVKRRYNPRLEIAGILPTKVQQHHQSDREFMDEIRKLEAQGFTIFYPIPLSTIFRKAARSRQPATKLYPHEKGSRRYYYLANQLTRIL